MSEQPPDRPTDGFDTAEHDFANDGTAGVYRQLKVEALRAWLWERGVHSSEIERMVDTGDRHLLNRIARDVGVNPPTKGSPTWRMVIDDLCAKEEWARAHPRDPRSYPSTARPPYLPTKEHA